MSYDCDEIACEEIKTLLEEDGYTDVEIDDCCDTESSFRIRGETDVGIPDCDGKEHRLEINAFAYKDGKKYAIEGTVDITVYQTYDKYSGEFEDDDYSVDDNSYTATEIPDEDEE